VGLRLRNGRAGVRDDQDDDRDRPIRCARITRKISAFVVPLRARAWERVMAARPGETARRLTSEDLAVKAGRLAVEVMTWMVSAGNVHFENVRAPRSMAEAEED
jgi:hypothetical protein